MNKRPRSITVLSWLFIAVGCISLTYHLLPGPTAEPNPPSSSRTELIFICLVRLLALIGGVFMLFGHNWARWLLFVWMGYHVFLSALHSWFQTVVHVALFGLITWFLFRPQASSYFRAKTAEAMTGVGRD